MSCVVITDKIREFASHFEDETPESIANVLGLWWEANPERMEELPLVTELGKFINELRANEATSALEEAISPSFEAQRVTTLKEQRAVDLVFDPRIRRDRVTLISRFFSNEVNLALKEKQDAINRRMMEETLNEGERDNLRNELYSLDRLQVIKELTPGGVFNRVRNIFQKYLDSTEDERVQAELKKINSAKGAEKYSDERKLAAAKKRADYKTQEYQKVVDHFKPLAEEASSLLLMTEGIRVNPDYVSPEDANFNDNDPDGNSEVDNQSDDYSKEESYKDGWMTNYKHVSSHESLSQAVRKVIRETPSLDYRGKYEKDDLGNNKYLDANYVHATLIDKLRDMVTSKDMIPLLEDLSKLKPWVKQIIKVINNDDSLFSQFYQDFRKDFIQYWIQKKVNKPDGTFTIETISVNKPEGVYYLLDSWRDNYESGTILDEDSVYEKNGEINKGNAEKGLSIAEELNNQLQRLNTQERLDFLNNEETWNKLIKVLNMVGIDPNPSILRIALENIRTAPGIEFTDPIMLLLPQLNIIFNGIQKGEVKSETLEDGTVRRGDLINTFGSAYNSIASMLAEVTEDAIESSVRENGKTYNSHVNPSYLGKLIKQLKNVRNDKNGFDKFIQDEFKQYEWFYKDGQWRSDWIEKLVTDPSMRKALQHKVVLNYDKISYQDLDDLDYTIMLLNEYWAEPKEKMAWYHVPILSDSPSAEFIRFVRYTTGSETDEEGNIRTYHDIILDKIINLVNQEYDRIQLVRERDARYLAGENISPIANFDISRNKEGSIKSLGGAEFKFIPELNGYKYENGEAFLDRFERLRKGDPSEFREFLKNTLNDIMEEGFESTYAEWANIGLFDELSNGKFKYIPFQGQSQTNQKVTKSLNEAQKVLGNLFTTDMMILLNKYSNNKAINDREADIIFSQIKEILNEKVTRGELSVSESNSISRNLNTKNNSKDALREYYWNSKFATSQIIQMTTTDLAFYKDTEDFQKRYKEVHAPSLRLNTMAKFNGETIGRTWERTIYLADDEIVSSTIADIKEVLDAKIAKGEMTTIERDYILSQFENVNVADAQAYRSLSSYRAMMGMMGQWTDDMETAYKHLIDPNGQWTMEDFNIIWQTKKPYVYTQVNNDSGIEGHTGIKTPVQHKNSEFLLLALHEAIAGPLGKSGKLKAINDFMEKNQIDVVQFESTTKVGKQGIINLNTRITPEIEKELKNKFLKGEITQEQLNEKFDSYRIKAYDDVIDVLRATTGIAQGIENPNVVHKVSYEDYGIQTATPEHAIDAVQLIGTQIRKLITADIADDAQITVGKKTMTKAEWLKLYNAINTENILQSFKEVNDIFQDPKEVEKIILEEIRSNTRYSLDMVRACTLDENGNFNIPLFDPVQSNMVQQLLNSIIKSRITKQKIRGGALIQVSSYGVTDQLKIVYEGEGENKRIKYLECYMPAYSREFYEPLMGENGQLNIRELPENLRKLIGYRVPTEDKYSMVPLYIKEFLPQQNGSAIMLPAEITTLSGSDFDVDKLYIMLPEFNVVKYDYAQAKRDFKGSSEAMNELAQLFNVGSSVFSDLANAPITFTQWFEENKERYKLQVPRVSKIEYNYDKLPQEQSLEARNNALIDMMWGILTNPDTASKILNPGGFDKQKVAARVVTILDSMTEKELAKEGYTIADILKLSLDTSNLDKLNKLAAKAKKKLDPLSPRTQVILHQQNMTGGKMIGIYANHNANHALMQHTQLTVDDTNGAFNYAGVKRTSLHGVKNEKGDFISRNTANFLAASVDNVKDNTLHATNQNTFTGDASMLLSRLGYTPTEIAILMRQPIVVEITEKVFRETRDGKSTDTIIDEVISDTVKYSGMYDNISWVNVKDNPYNLDELMKDIMLYKEVPSMSKEDRTNFYRRQATVGILFKRIMKTADALGKMVQATRSDTPDKAAGPTIADTMQRIQEVADLIKNSSSENYPLIGADVVRDDITYNGDINSLREELLNSPLPFLQAFYTLGVQQTEEMLNKYFPFYSDSFREVLDGKYDDEGNLLFEGLRQMTKTGKLDVRTINSIYNDLLAYIMSKTEFFGSGMNRNGKVVSSAEKRKDFINNFPTYFKKLINDNEDIAELEFIKRLKVVRSNDRNPVSVIVFKNVGQLTPTLRERYMRDWATLLYMENPKAHELALNLFLYSYYRNGFAFGPSTFIHLAPVALRDVVPDYISTLRNVLTEKDSYEDFIEQYIYNHLDNRKLVPEIPETATTKFVDEKGNPKEEVSITIDSTSTYGDKAAVKKEIRDADGNPVYDFFNFIAKKVKGKYIYYRMSGLDGIETAIYTRIEPLGYKNSFLEYEYGKKAFEIETVIDKNKKDYDPLAEYTTQHMDTKLTDETLSTMPDYSENYSEEAMASFTLSVSSSKVYGEPLSTPVSDSDSITDIAPNEAYRDANDDEICGGAITAAEF